MTEQKIGDIIQLDGYPPLTVVASTDCTSCYFDYSTNFCTFPEKEESLRRCARLSAIYQKSPDQTSDSKELTI